MRRAISELLAITQSKKFTAYTEGVPVTLPSGESFLIKIQRTRRSIRPMGLRFSEYAFITDVTAGVLRATGFGEASTQVLAFQKSIAEGVERVMYRAMKSTLTSQNSNGWAAHLNQKKAYGAALDELLERDAVLVHWLCQKPMTEVSRSTWPKWLADWVTNELALAPRFGCLRVLVSTLGYVPTVTTILLDKEGYAVLSHATGETVAEGLRKALSETCRIAQIAIEGTFTQSSQRLENETFAGTTYPEDHAVFYAVHRKLPSWIFGPSLGWKSVEANWAKARKDFDISFLQVDFVQITTGPLVVGYCKSPKVQNLFFGPSSRAEKSGLINIDRIKEVKHEGPLNLMPHWVP